jgi:trimeric autotransporter adhesin
MRVPSVQGTRGKRARGCFLALWLFAALLFGARDASAQLTQQIRETGHINFVTTGGSLRTQPNDDITNTAECQLATTSTQALSGIPAGRTVYRAYLYWGGSGATTDSSVTLNNVTVNAQRTFTNTFVNGGTNYPYFGGFADITNLNIVTGNNTFTFGNLTVNSGAPHCDRAAVVSGWSLIVMYQDAAEPLRAITIYDGLENFFGDDVSLAFTGFRIPSSGIDGRLAVFTLEGDPGNSTAANGFDEALRFNGTLLDDGLVPAGSVPTVQQFDGTINTQNVVTSYGIDVDQYNVGSLLSTGQTTATTTYSAGADLVLLMAQVMSATSDPQVNLTATMTSTGPFISGGTGTYNITVSNVAGNEREDNTVTVTGTLPAGLTYNSVTGAGWSCSAAGQVVTCTHPPTLNSGASFPVLGLVVNVAEAAAASVNYTVTVSTPSYEIITNNNSASVATATLDPNVSTSTKTVLDVNGGEASPGDILRYTITLTETAGGQAINVSVLDAIPDNTTWSGFVSVPAGSTGTFIPPSGPAPDGQASVTGITVPANGSVTVVFEVTVVLGTLPGQTVANTATITNPNGPENNPAAPTLVVNPSLIPSTGTKFVYLRNPGGVTSLSRIVPTSATDAIRVVAANGSQSFTLSPPLRTAFSINAGAIPVRLWLRRGSNNPTSRNVTVTLTASDGFTTTVTNPVTPPNSTTPTLADFSLPNTLARTFPVGTTFTLTVANAGSNTISIYPYGNGTAGNNSRIEFNATTVVNVDSVTTWSAAFNGGVAQTTFYPGQSVFIRAQVSDPFGAFDIGGANITIIDPSNVTQLNNVAMVAQGAPATCGSTAAATCIFQTQFNVPASPSLGGWTIRVTAREGTEGTVTDLGVGNFTVAIPQPSLTLVKTSTVLSDPQNLAVNPKRVPNAVVRYEITVTNSGPGTVDAGTLVITDPIPANSTMYVAGASPVVFLNGTPASGLTFTYASHVTYSSTGGTGPWNYTPAPDANGFDPLVRAVRIAPAGVMSAAGAGNPSFTIQFQVKIN